MEREVTTGHGCWLNSALGRGSNKYWQCWRGVLAAIRRSWHVLTCFLPCELGRELIGYHCSRGCSTLMFTQAAVNECKEHLKGEGDVVGKRGEELEVVDLIKTHQLHVWMSNTLFWKFSRDYPLSRNSFCRGAGEMHMKIFCLFHVRGHQKSSSV